MTPTPVPAVLGRQASEQGPLPGKQGPQRVQKQAFAKAAWAAQKIGLALFGQLYGKGSFINVVVVFFADVRERLDANGQLFAWQRRTGAR